jgi:NADH dehydrogenase
MRAVVLGAGYAGLTLARRLERRLPEAADLVVVDADPEHLVLHEVHRVVRRPEVADYIRVPLADVLDRAEVVVARVERVDRDAREVHLDDGDRLPYDYAAICLGSVTAYHGLPGVREHSTPLKSVADAERIREEFLALDAGDRVVVGGAGLSGVQVAGELAALAREEDRDVDVTLLERLDSVAPSFPENFRTAVREALEEQGVAVRTGVAVERATADGLETDAGPVAADQLVWTGGITGPPATAGERPAVRSDLRVDDRTFALGDAARVVDADGEPVPASASAAIREAGTAAENLAALVEHDLHGSGMRPRLDNYHFSVPGWIVSVGDDAVAQLGPTVLRGSAARAMKATVGAGHLTSVGAVTRAVELAGSELAGDD